MFERMWSNLSLMAVCKCFRSRQPVMVRQMMVRQKPRNGHLRQLLWQSVSASCRRSPLPPTGSASRAMTVPVCSGSACDQAWLGTHRDWAVGIGEATRGAKGTVPAGGRTANGLAPTETGTRAWEDLSQTSPFPFTPLPPQAGRFLSACTKRRDDQASDPLPPSSAPSHGYPS
jgi:hypothetical protein